VFPSDGFRVTWCGCAGCRETIALTENLVKVVDVMRQRLEHRGELSHE
jgi:hypothetical protein